MTSTRRLVIRAGAVRLGLRADQVRQVLSPLPLTVTPHAPAAMLGLAVIAGQATPVIDMARLIDADAPTTRVERLVVLAAPCAALAVEAIEGLDDMIAAAPVERLYADHASPVDLAILLDQHFQTAWLEAQTR